MTDKISGAIRVQPSNAGAIAAERRMIADCGMTIAETELAMGRNRGALNKTLRHGGHQFADTMLGIASACGYEVWLVPDGKDVAEAVAASVVGPALDEAADAFRETAFYALTHRDRRKR